jgi:hypothetical protein
MSAYAIVNLKDAVEDSLGERAPGVSRAGTSTPSTVASPMSFASAPQRCGPSKPETTASG